MLPLVLPAAYSFHGRGCSRRDMQPSGCKNEAAAVRAALIAVAATNDGKNFIRMMVMGIDARNDLAQNDTKSKNSWKVFSFG